MIKHQIRKKIITKKMNKYQKKKKKKKKTKQIDEAHFLTLKFM